MTSCKIENTSTVVIHFIMRLEDGVVAKDTYEEKPVKFTYGDGSFSEVFERALLGLKVGDKTTVSLKPEDAFGEVNPRNIQRLPKDRFEAGMDLSPGSVIEFTQGGGQQIFGIVKASDDAMVTVDFNHPLSGRHLSFDVEIVELPSH